MSEQERIEIILRLEHALKQSDAPFVDRVPREVMLALLASNAALPTARAQLAVLAEALREIERHCPCGARPESPRTHPHVISCPFNRVRADPALAAMIEGVPR